MKKLLLLLLIASSAITVSAQKDYRDNDRNERYHYKHEQRKDVRGRHDNNDRNKREYQRQMSQINAEFDSRVRSVRKNPFMGRAQKNRKIEELEMHRRVALRESRDRFTGNRSRDFAREKNNNRRKWQ
jgi:hypothetical protein